MTTLHVLLPPMAAVMGDRGWRRWLAHGDRLPDAADARRATIRELLRFPGDRIPVAALRHACHAQAVDAAAWLCADPAWVRSEATGARLMAWPLTDLAADEAERLAAALRPLFGDAGVPLAVDTPSAWCVRLADGTPTARFTDPADALGVALLECLPEGDAGRTWRRLFTEVQVVLHAHPVNAARVAAGKHPVNALWFWGAGVLPEAVETRLGVVASADDVLRGLARLGGAEVRDPAAAALQGRAAGDETLLDLDAVGHPEAALAWLPAFQALLRGGRCAAVELTFADGARFRLKYRHRLRFWRRA